MICIARRRNVDLHVPFRIHMESDMNRSHSTCTLSQVAEVLSPHLLVFASRVSALYLNPVRPCRLVRLAPVVVVVVVAFPVVAFPVAFLVAFVVVVAFFVRRIDLDALLEFLHSC